MVTCDDFGALLDALVGDELPAARRQEIAAHLARCCRCSDELARYRQVIALARRLPARPPPPTLLDRFRAALDDRSASTPAATAQADRPAGEE
jgi:anti-sigma factor RsiW